MKGLANLLIVVQAHFVKAQLRQKLAQPPKPNSPPRPSPPRPSPPQPSPSVPTPGPSASDDPPSGGNGLSCSGNDLSFSTDTTGACMTGWSSGNAFSYPEDFGDILNEVSIYVCPTSGRRVIYSNGIPDHDVRVDNPNIPCEQMWAISMPLNPEKASSATETPPRGIIAIAINGVPTYGALETSSENAVDPTGEIQDAQFWYGHSDMDKIWHFHNPYMGHETADEDTLLGYALDGFPIYGPLEDDSVLDSCNGLTLEDGSYVYHVREKEQVDSTLEYCNGKNPENNWNYIVGCYSGSMSDTIVGGPDSFSLPDDCYIEDNEISSEVA